MPITSPVDAGVPQRSPDAPAPGQAIPSHYRWCFGCGSDHPTGLHMQITAGSGMNVHGTFHVSEHHQGAPGLAHGGVLTVAMDEVLGSLNWLLAGPAVTGRIEVDFKRPVPVGTTLFIDAEVTAVSGRKVFTSAVGRIDAADGPVAVTATALFVQVPVQHFFDNGAPEHVREAVEDRARGGPAWRPDPASAALEVNP